VAGSVWLKKMQSRKNCEKHLDIEENQMSHPATQTADGRTKAAWKSQMCQSVRNRNWF
jgi:hypothetical protein